MGWEDREWEDQGWEKVEEGVPAKQIVAVVAGQEITGEGEKQMIIAITSTGPTEESTIDKRFGRARYFLIYDTEKDEFKPLDNLSGMNEMQGAGVSSGEKMFKAGVEVVVTGHVGPKAYRTLNASKIKVAFCKEDVTVKEAAAMYVDGKLTVSDGPDVEEHW